MEYLEFEQPVKELIEQYEKCVQLGTESGINVDESCKKIKDKIKVTPIITLSTLFRPFFPASFHKEGSVPTIQPTKNHKMEG